MKFTYKNISENEVVVPNIGSAQPGETIASEVEIKSPYLELVPSAPVSPVKDIKEDK